VLKLTSVVDPHEPVEVINQYLIKSSEAISHVAWSKETNVLGNISVPIIGD